MEELLSKFRMFGEAQSLMREDINSLKPRFDTLEQKVDVLESAVRTNGRDINALKDAVHGNTEAIHAMQNDLKNINQRLEVVEAKVAS
jgi:tetrahydromethanopterin S-methyltransferase subunit G